MILKKRKFLFLAVVLFLSSLLLVVPNYDYGFLQYVKNDSQVSFYMATKSHSVPTYVTKTDVGCGEILQCHSSNAQRLSKKLDDIAGISFSFTGNEKDIENFLKEVDAFVLKSENIDSGLQILLAHSPKFQNRVMIDGNSVNLQIAISGDTITIGSPLILGEY